MQEHASTQVRAPGTSPLSVNPDGPASNRLQTVLFTSKEGGGANRGESENKAFSSQLLLHLCTSPCPADALARAHNRTDSRTPTRARALGCSPTDPCSHLTSHMMPRFQPPTGDPDSQGDGRMNPRMILWDCPSYSLSPTSSPSSPCSPQGFVLCAGQSGSSCRRDTGSG